MRRFFRALSPRLCLKFTLIVSSMVLLPCLAAAQQPGDTVTVLVRAYAEMVRATRNSGIWPGFQPDTIPVAFVLPARGQLMLGWPGELPAGFERSSAPNSGWRAFAATTAASTSIDIAGHSVAQVSVGRLDAVTLAGVAAHEAFHAFALQSKAADSRFGERENAFLVASYPVLNAENDALMSLEGKLLAGALTETRVEAARALAQQFVAVRAERHRLLGPDLANFEDQAEINEGLAEYALLTTGNLLAKRSLSAASPELLRDLRDVTADPVQSFRLRYYKVGPAQALLLDKLSGPEWKITFLREKHTFADLLARASGAHAVEDRALNTAEQRENITVLRSSSAERIAQLQVFRRAQIDSILAKPGTVVLIGLSALPNSDVNWCGIDPQNLLQASERVLLHMRYLNACSGRSVSAEFATPVVQDRAAAELRAVVEGDLRITAGGSMVTVTDAPMELTDVRISAPTFNAQFGKAVLQRSGRVLRITPRI